MTTYTFLVPGIPVPQGSKRAMLHAQSNRVVMFDQRSDKLAEYRANIIQAVATSELDQPLLGPVFMEITFAFPRPKSHFGTGRNAGVLKAGMSTWHIKTPDADKCLRAVLDSLTVAGVWKDDSQVCDVRVIKIYSDMPSTGIKVMSDD